VHQRNYCINITVVNSSIISVSRLKISVFVSTGLVLNLILHCHCGLGPLQSWHCKLEAHWLKVVSVYLLYVAVLCQLPPTVGILVLGLVLSEIVKVNKKFQLTNNPSSY